MKTTTLALVAALAASSAHAQVPDAAQPAAPDAGRGGAPRFESSHRIAEAVARGEMADAVVGERHASTLPTAAALAGYTRTNHVDAFGIPLPPTNQLRVIYPDIPDNFRTRLDLQWPIYTGGRLDALERAARIDASASADEVAAARGDLKLEITRAYWALVTAGEALRVVEQSLASVNAHLRDVRNQLDAGVVPPSDVFTVDAQASRQRMLRVQAGSARDSVEAELGRLVGAAPGNTDRARRGPGCARTAARPARGPDRVGAASASGARRAAQTHGRGRRARARGGGRHEAHVAVGGGVDYASPNPRLFPREDAWPHLVGRERQRELADLRRRADAQRDGGSGGAQGGRTRAPGRL